MRWLYVIGITVLLLTLLADNGDAACSEANPCIQGLGQGKAFEEPDQIDIDSFRRIQLDVDIAEVQFGWLKLKRRVYNGKVTGPTWNVQKGSHVYLTLNNKLSDLNNEKEHGKENELGRPNTTNMHTHGLHISSMSPQDNVGINVKPGEKYYYKYCLHEEQPAGTCWYHAHVHGSTIFQVHSGLAGMLIVKDDPNTLEGMLRDASCPDNCENDIQMIFQALLQFTSELIGFSHLQEVIGDDPTFRPQETLKTWLENNVNFMTVNGLLQPVLTLEQGKMYRFRMVNAAGFDTIEPIFAKKGTNESSDACTIREIALDGIYLDKPRKLHREQSFLAPGYRVDWMVKCDRPGQYELRSYPDPKNEMSTGVIDRWAGLLVSITVKRKGNDGHYYPKKRRNQLMQQLEEADTNKDNDRKKFFGDYGWDQGQDDSYYGYHGSSNHGWGHGPPSRGGWYGSPSRGWGRGSPSHGWGHGSPSHGWGEGSPGHRPPGHGSPNSPKHGWDKCFDIKLPERPRFVKDLRNVAEEDIKERFVMEFNTGLQLNREKWTAGDNYRYAMTVDTIQEWHIVSADSLDSHPFHPHINSFQVISYNKYTGPFTDGFQMDPILFSQEDEKPCHFQRQGKDGKDDMKPEEKNPLKYLGHEERHRQYGDDALAYARVGDWKDTLLIPPLSNITIRFLPDRYTGNLIIHCHLLFHEDEGMMMITKIAEPGESLLANITSGNAYPGTCNRCDRYPFNNPKTLCEVDETTMNQLNHNNIRPSPIATEEKRSKDERQRQVNKKNSVKRVWKKKNINP